MLWKRDGSKLTYLCAIVYGTEVCRMDFYCFQHPHLCEVIPIHYHDNTILIFPDTTVWIPIPINMYFMQKN